MFSSLVVFFILRSCLCKYKLYAKTNLHEYATAVRRLASRLELAREPLTSRAEPTFPARKMTEPSLARLANPPSHTEPSRAWLGSARFQP